VSEWVGGESVSDSQYCFGFNLHRDMGI